MSKSYDDNHTYDTQEAFEVQITEFKEDRHASSGVLLKVNTEVLFNGTISAIDKDTAAIKAIWNVRENHPTADADMLKVKIRPFCS